MVQTGFPHSELPTTGCKVSRSTQKESRFRPNLQSYRECIIGLESLMKRDDHVSLTILDLK